MKLKTILVLAIIFLLVGAIAVEAKGGKGGGKSGGTHIISSFSKSISSKAADSSQSSGLGSKVVSMTALATKSKKKLDLDDLVENETEEAEESPGFGVFAGIFSLIALRRIWTKGHRI